ncbi:glucose sorbosone dehydrogenase [Carbonactinospora thermoautotrophica]|uniref:Glucose sorbosone dehydrogenase n=1 Tax=Carbonactinospora thermoautotrophica TaxID=1469144 RepID=A0A132MRW3_9ACTN|nr:PQQ-dependent sugar dehydrogenase [Carbonactinospora thermoautotrophica]KWX00618.1 glucose sorbosone dehydrogenase [Carbonactinospora thermoautotrophica]
MAVYAAAALLAGACTGGTPPGDDSRRPPAAETAGPSAAARPGMVRAARVPTPRVAGTVAEGLTTPWGLAFLPDGSALVSERDTGRIKRVTSGGQIMTVGQVPGVAPGGEGGLLGIAVSPNYRRDRLLYAYFTAAEDNRVVRMTYHGGRLGAPQPVVTGIPKGHIHNGGRIRFGPDGMLYIGTGESGDRPLSQDLGSLGGKILRVTPEGKPAPGNPFNRAPLVYSYGHRNVQGLAFDSGGRLWAAEFGQNTWDELNLIKSGQNYGWPHVEGKGDRPRYRDPVAQWGTAEASPSGIAIKGDVVYLAALRGSRLWQVPIQGDTAGKPREFFTREYGRLRTVEVAPDGSLWVITSNTDGRGSPRRGDDRILRVVLD